MLAAIVTSLMLLLATVPGRSEAAEAYSHAGKLLVASEKLNDPNFRQTVVYLVEHDHNGAMGIVVNRLIAEGPLDALLESLGHVDSKAESGRTVRLYEGGPVGRGSALLLHSDDYSTAGTLPLRDHLALSIAEPALDDMAKGQGPRQSLLALGHAGWTAGQLEQELAQGAWHVVEMDPSLIFDDEPAKVWRRALNHRGFDL